MKEGREGGKLISYNIFVTYIRNGCVYPFISSFIPSIVRPIVWKIIRKIIPSCIQSFCADGPTEM